MLPPVGASCNIFNAKGRGACHTPPPVLSGTSSLLPGDPPIRHRCVGADLGHVFGGHIGKVGAEVSVEDAYTHARQTGLNLLAVAHMALGDLGRVRRVVKLLGMVNGAPTFGDHPKVINGCSDLLVNVFGDVGRHARSAVGMGSLPGNMTVEIEAILQVDG